MLTLSKPLNAGQAATYHANDFASVTQSYYAKDDMSLGEWQGSLADRYGLAGAVSRDDFLALANGEKPQTGERMVRHRVASEYRNPDGSTTRSVEHRAGWDATFSAPKSVSLTALVGGDERVRIAHREAVTEALSELERYTQARIGGNHPAETTGRFIAAKFEHDTARPVDGYAAPQLHTHAVIFNVTERGDGSPRALDGRAFFESQTYATAVYQAQLTYKLRDLGYEIERGRSGAPEIKGYSQEYLDASSPRSEQIRKHLERKGVKGPEAAQIAAHTTREKKEHLSQAQVLQAHRDVASSFGNQANHVIGLAAEQSLKQGVRLSSAACAQEAMTFARDHIYEREAVADEREIMTVALRRGMSEANFAEVRGEFASWREQGQFRSVTPERYSSAPRFTTPETLAAELANIQSVQEGRSRLAPIMTEREALAQANTRDFLNESQRRVIQEVLTSSDRVHGLQGLAGTGKTTALASIREGVELKGYKVEGFAPTSRAAGQLREAGIEAATLQSFLARKVQETASVRYFYMLDESSLASSQQMRAFLQKVQPRDRVLVIGDTRQHQGVEAGRPFEQMQQAGMRTSQLDQIMRQKDPALLRAVQHLATGETRQGVAALIEQGRVTEIQQSSDRIAAIAKDYADRPDRTIVVSPDNRSRQLINEAIRAELQTRGQLSSDDREFVTLTHRSDLTGAGRTWAALYHLDDVVRYEQGSNAYGLERGSQARVVGVDDRTNTLTVQREDGETISYDPRRVHGVNVFEERMRVFSVGDRVQFTSANMELGVANRDLGSISALESHSITVRMDGKGDRQITFDPTVFRQIDLGYAVTSHSSQGLTTDRVIANIDTASNRALINDRLAYVAISRAAYDARIYTNDMQTLAERLSNEVSKTAAINISTEPRWPASEFRPDDAASTSTQRRDASQVHIYADSEHRRAAVAREYLAKGAQAVIWAPDKIEREDLTRLIRAELHEQGRLGETRTIAVLIDKELTDRAARAVSNYDVGDVLHYSGVRSIALGMVSGSYGKVLNIDHERNLITVGAGDDSSYTYNPAEERQLRRQSTACRAESRELSVGDRIQFTQTDKQAGSTRGVLATVEKFYEDGSIAVKIDAGTSLQLTPERAQHIDFGYAVESSRQSVSDRTILSGDAGQIASQRAAFENHIGKRGEVSIYTSDSGKALTQVGSMAEAVVQASGNELSVADVASPSIKQEGFAIDL